MAKSKIASERGRKAPVEGQIKFLCSQCGACCKRVQFIPNFTEPLRDDGTCVHLRADNSCAIYAMRPLVCRVDKMYERRQKEFKKLSRKQYYILNSLLCNEFMSEDNISEQYRINIELYEV